MSIFYKGYILRCDHCTNQIAAETISELYEFAMDKGWANESPNKEQRYTKCKCPLCIKEDAALDKMKNPATDSSFAS